MPRWSPSNGNPAPTGTLSWPSTLNAGRRAATCCQQPSAKPAKPGHTPASPPRASATNAERTGPGLARRLALQAHIRCSSIRSLADTQKQFAADPEGAARGHGLFRTLLKGSRRSRGDGIPKRGSAKFPAELDPIEHAVLAGAARWNPARVARTGWRWRRRCRWPSNLARPTATNSSTPSWIAPPGIAAARYGRARRTTPWALRLQLGEFELIDRYFLRGRGTRSVGVVLGIGDDAALLALPPGQLVAAVDTIVSGRHFPPTAKAFDQPHRAGRQFRLGCHGGDSRLGSWLVTLPVPTAVGPLPQVCSIWPTPTRDWSATTSRSSDGERAGPGARGRRHGAARGGARRRFIGGHRHAGDAGAGLAWSARPPNAQAPRRLALIERFEYPAPRVQFGRAARGIATAAMDVSDGLAGDLPKLGAGRSLAAHVAVERLPYRTRCGRPCPCPSAGLGVGAGDAYELLRRCRRSATAISAAAAQLA